VEEIDSSVAQLQQEKDKKIRALEEKYSRAAISDK